MNIITDARVNATLKVSKSSPTPKIAAEMISFRALKSLTAAERNAIRSEALKICLLTDLPVHDDHLRHNLLIFD